ncbi:MAG: glycosyltransferase family 2 protein [Candidatus Shapirobacteria bacterium]|nr:glycosyltransferase family 2 protein [Candidatus Shapirobacteria bacterium]MDD5074150.1 glycosyltransferase family 2 protein [Candidatus Shapirobacteria bacterium]MDD5481759.1 glycosyltransferase family 2 protein [Candidatus Shapirobacteria bacterium]
MAVNKVTPKISVNVIARNEEADIADCLKSARLLANEVVFVDMESTDRTKKIAEKLADKTYSHPQTGYVEPARNFGIEKCNGDWVFVLDADERITPELASLLKEKIHQAEDGVGAMAVARKNINFGFWLKKGGWWPDYQVRFIKKENFIDWPEQIHSFPKIKGAIINIDVPFIHLAIKDIEEMLERTIRYSEKEANLLFGAGRKTSVFLIIRRMLGEFWRRGIKGQGLLDGPAGIVQVFYQTFSVFVTQARLWEKQVKEGKNG